MANLMLQLEEQLADMRSREKTYRFTVENKGNKTVLLRPVTPQIPEGVTLLDVKQSTERVILLKRSILLTELTAILKSYQVRLSSNMKSGIFERIRTQIQTPSPSPAPQIVIDRSSTDTSKKTFDFQIEDEADADDAVERWFKNDPASPEAELFNAKLGQLRRYNGLIEAAGGAEKAAQATLPPGSTFATTYVFRFDRGRVDTKRYMITIETAYLEDGSEIEETASVSQSAIVSPSPAVLSVVAIFSSVLGAILKAAVISTSPASATQRSELVEKNAVTAADALTSLGQQLTPTIISLQMLGAMVVALLLFNIYEHTDLGTRIKMGVAWRSALLVGVLSGAFTERLLEALKVLAGVK